MVVLQNLALFSQTCRLGNEQNTQPYPMVPKRLFLVPGLVNIQKAWKTTMLLMGKPTISMAIFNSKLSVY
jgi:hypothetical protein